MIEPEDRWWAASRKDAVEYLELEIFRRDSEAQYHQHFTGRALDQSDATVTLPLDAARLVLDCAFKGMHKGQGRRRVPLSHFDHNAREGIYAWARRRKAKLIAKSDPDIMVGPRGHRRPSAAKAEAKAAEEARAFAASDRYGLNLATSTIIRGMRSRS